MSTVRETEQRKRFSGVYSLLLTPFQPDRSIDWNGYDEYVDWQLSMSPQGLFAVCGSSEMGQLTSEERLSLAERAVNRAGNTPVIATANVDPEIGRHAEDMHRMAETGVSALVLIPPSGVGDNQQQLGAYFAELADRSPLPILLYECPLHKPHLIDSQVYADLVTRHGIIGIKDTTSTIEGILAKITGAPDGIVYQANTRLMLDAIRLGAGGIMAITATAAADVVLKLWLQASAGSAEAADTHRKLVELNDILEMGYTATAKYLAALRGVPMGSTTRSGSTVSAEATAALRKWVLTAF